MSARVFTVVVSAGTYHYPFDRLIEWIEPWAASHPEVRFVVQHGPGRPLPLADNRVTVDYGELLELLATADAVVLQGGAGGVMDAREVRRIPIVVPRIPVHNEVIDDHQVLFSRHVAALGIIHLATSAVELERLLDAALAGELETRTGPVEVTAGVENFGRVLNGPPPVIDRAGRLRRARRAIGSVLRPSRAGS